MDRTYLSHRLADTHKLGERFVNSIPPGTTVALCGTLGAGKTAFVQGVGLACGIKANLITSPTFVLCNEYVGNRSIYHLDAYRLADSDEFSELGPEEMYQSNHYVFIEWADRVFNSFPREYITIHIEIKSRDSRLFVVTSTDTLKQNVQWWMDSISDD
jgi:tRNA threonylcarbamoyladenosine biosynthesis protein TsaE